ncbi:ABC transporter C family protein (macronuclear) [Tetrahymena thermophila SB210]|uniref:ABC transporter C family protein n=1 Tax=Tetrahymena thermophila (strain SB210) TaxID=312017 RepID=Q239I5_TETTS|nr:ABC transporter C family protein [Tetrahymena thermophila SB210]EAR93205.2 ABC transporter C family protein [Tetrahymena thermophila SB210]|eukprot:XP_001013450.2 ABC transporter C family protein [Tetrahymena thermophila SB210]
MDFKQQAKKEQNFYSTTQKNTTCFQNQIESDMQLQQTKRQANIYCEEVLPSSGARREDHNVFFTALTKLFKHINQLYREDKQIQSEDLNDYTTKSTQVKVIIENLEQYKQHHPSYFENQNNFNLGSIYFNMTYKSFFFGLFYSILQSVLSCGCILLMDIITDKLKNYQTTYDEKRDICLLLAAVAVAYILKNIFFSRYMWYQAQWKANAQATLQYLVFSKSLRTQVSTSSTGQGNEQEQSNETEENPNANNIITVDIDQQQQLFWALIQTTQSIVTILIVLLFIYYKMGKSILHGLYILLGSTVFNIVITHFLGVCFDKQFQQKDQRVSLCKDVIDAMKSIKYLCWEDIFKRKIQKIRSREFKQVTAIRIIDGVLGVFWNCLSYFLLFFFLVNYVDDGNILADCNVFTIIALFGILTDPISLIPWCVGDLVKCRVSFKRIKKFLNQNQINHNNTADLDERNQVNQSSFFDSAENDTTQIAIQIKKKIFKWPSFKSVSHDNYKDLSKKSKVEQLNDNQQSLLQNQYESSNVQGTSNFELKIHDLTIQKGEMAIIIGEIGSGKSALLQGILNEMDIEQMNIQDSLISSNNQSFQNQERLLNFEKKLIVNGKIAYVSQNHWLQNKTIKENILFGSEYDSLWYNQCIECCDLRVDFDSFQKKDDKLIGPGGCNLSGGQRQRIAICRALYQKCDIYLFDDILSSLDAHVAEKVYQQVILETLIKKLKKTVLLVTSHFSIFSNREMISKIFYVQKGSLVSNQEEIEKFILSGQSQLKEQEEAKKLREQTEIQEEFNQQDLTNELNEMMNCQETEIQNEKIKNLEFNKNKERDFEEKQKKKYTDEDEDQQQDDEEEREKGNIKLKTLTTYMKYANYFLLVIFFIANFMMQGSQMIIDFWLRDKVSPSSTFFEDINNIFKSFTDTFLFFIFLNLGMTALRSFFYCLCALLSSKKIFSKLNSSIIFSKMKFFDQNSPGRIINRISDDIFTIDQDLPWNCHVFLEQLAYTFGYSIGILIQFPWLVVFVLVSLVFIYFIQKFFRHSNREIKRLNSVNQGRLLNALDEADKGLILIRAFGKERLILKDYLEKLNDSVNSFLISQTIQIWMSIRLLFVSNFLFICVVITGMIFILGEIDFNYTTVSMCLTYSILLSSKFSDLVQYFCNTEQYLVSVERIRQYFNNDKENLLEVQQNQKFTNVQIQPSNNNEQQDFEIKFDDVYLTYDNINESTDISKDSKEIQFALKGFNLKIKKGEKIAFCGRTGSGKTSIFNTLFNMYPIQHGNIHLKSKNIQSFCLKDLRQQMSIIPQFGFLYNASLQDNLDPEGKIPRQIIQQKVGETNLKIRNHSESEDNESNKQKQMKEYQSEVIEIDQQNDDMLDFEVEEGGQNLSNGEKQVVNFLRIILREADIVCLDEATSNMDPKTDAELHKQIFKFTENKTLLVITHRLENIELFDRVAVLDQGKIVECGHVNDLRKIQGGFFNKLIKKSYD